MRFLCTTSYTGPQRRTNGAGSIKARKDPEIPERIEDTLNAAQKPILTKISV